VPTSYPWRDFTADGGLMNYGADIREQFPSGILCGAHIAREKPADMLVQRRPSSFVLNLKTARAWIEPSPMLLSLADEVIE
jgi:hypothetical protein